MKTFIIFLLVFFLGNAMALGFTLPLPENTVREEDGVQAEANNTQFDLAVYRSSLSVEKILSFYKENLTKEGFRLLTEDIKAKSLYFAHPETDERFVIVVDDESSGDETYIRVSHWYGNLPDYRDFLSEGGKKDIPGKDLAGIPRYPGAVRVSSLEYGPVQTASYKSDDSKEDILNFYEDRMVSSGWKKSSIADPAREKAAKLLGMPSNIAEGGCVYFEKKEKFLTILVQEACCGQKGRAISIVETDING
jgi:hypothetical protein